MSIGKMVNVARKGEACVVARCPSPLFRPARGEGFEQDDILTAFERFEVVEIEATGRTALGIGVAVHDHEAVEAMIARVGPGRYARRKCRRRSRSAHGYLGQHPSPGCACSLSRR